MAEEREVEGEDKLRGECVGRRRGEENGGDGELEMMELGEVGTKEGE